MWVLSQTLLDEMGSRIDDLEKSIGELVKEAGVDSPPSPSTSSQGQLPPKWAELYENGFEKTVQRLDGESRLLVVAVELFDGTWRLQLQASITPSIKAGKSKVFQLSISSKQCKLTSGYLPLRWTMICTSVFLWVMETN